MRRRRCLRLRTTRGRDDSRPGHKAASIHILRQLGNVLADIAAEGQAQDAEQNLRIRFGSQRLPFHASASSYTGVLGNNMLVEILHSKFARDVLISKKHTHESFWRNFDCKHDSCSMLASSVSAATSRYETLPHASDARHDRQSI